MQVLLSKGISEDDLEAELEEKLLDVDCMRTYDDGVNSVLVASAADEIASLRSQIEEQAAEIEQLKHRSGCADLAALYECIKHNAYTVIACPILGSADGICGNRSICYEACLLRDTLMGWPSRLKGHQLCQEAAAISILPGVKIMPHLFACILPWVTPLHE